MAKAELSEIKIDMNSVTTLKDFKRLVEKEETQNFVMFITVNYTKYEYKCKYRLETVFFLSENSTPFLSLCFDGDVLIQITGLTFKTIESLTPLDTTFYLLTFFYRMIQIETFDIFDNAIVTCKNKDKEDKDKTKYRALLYRLFATNKPLDELSIYYKYFTEIRLDMNHLKFKKLLKEYRSVYKIPEDFMDKPDCSEKAKLLNELFDTLRTTPEFQTFYEILSHFSVETKDSIYYPCCKTCNGLSCDRQGHLDKSKQSLFKSRNARKNKSKRRRSKLKNIIYNK
jgi:hypothetical protein